MVEEVTVVTKREADPPVPGRRGGFPGGAVGGASSRLTVVGRGWKTRFPVAHRL